MIDSEGIQRLLLQQIAELRTENEELVEVAGMVSSPAFSASLLSPTQR